MDTYDIHFLNNIINDYKNSIRNKFSKIHLNHKDLKNNSDDLCLIWDYNPKIADEKKIKEKFKIKPEIFEQNAAVELTLTKSKTFIVNDSFVKENMDNNSNNNVQNNSSNNQIPENQSIQNKNERSKEDQYFKSEHKKSEKSEKSGDFTQNKKGSKIMFHSSVFTNDKSESNKNKLSLNNVVIKKDTNEEKNNKENSNSQSNEDEDLSNNNKKSENKESQNVPVRKHRLTENSNLRVYLFSTQNYVDVQVFFGENINSLKKKILNILRLKNYREIFELSRQFNFSSNLLIRKSEIEDNEIENVKENGNPLNFLIKDHLYANIPDAYEIRHSQDDDDFKPNMDFAALEDKKSAVNTRIHTVCMINKIHFDPDEKKKQVKLGIQENGKVLINVFVKIESDKNENETEFSTKIEEDPNKNLSDLFERIKNKLLTNKINNYDYYNFYEHDSESTKKKNIDFLDFVYKEIPIDYLLKELKCFELDVSIFYLVGSKKIY